MESGFAFFIKSLWSGYNPFTDGSLLQYFLTIVIIGAVIFRMRKDQARAAIFTKLIWIAGVWGTLYGLCLTFLVAGNPNIPIDKIELIRSTGISASLTSVVLAAFGGFVATALDLFISKEQKA
ncbi:hypothetical protein JNL27_17235 [bacterium]|nr:hypothetical protein [bacterium]